MRILILGTSGLSSTPDDFCYYLYTVETKAAVRNEWGGEIEELHD